MRRKVHEGDQGPDPNDADNKLYNLDGSKVKDLMGSKVTLKGNLSADGNTITVESASKVAAK